MAFNRKLRPINKDYFLSLNFCEIEENGKRYLKKIYPLFFLFNEKSEDPKVFEITDIVSVIVYLEEINGKWIISKCLSNDNENERLDVFNVHFKSTEISELIKFDLLNGEDNFRHLIKDDKQFN